MVLLVISVTLAIATQSYDRYLERVAAQKAAELFTRDLLLARTSAMRDRQPAALLVYEGSREYVIRKVTGEVVVRREYGSFSDLSLSALELALPGDSVGFDGRGVAALTGGGGTLGTARFRSGEVTYRVRFNSMGVAEVERLP